MSEIAPTGVHDPESLGEIIALPEERSSTRAASRNLGVSLIGSVLPGIIATAASLMVLMVALPVLVPSGCSPGPDWVKDLESTGFLTTTLGVVLASFALGFRRPPLMPQALFHLGLLVVLFGAASNFFQRHLGVLALEPGQTSNRFESASGPRLLPFSLRLQGQLTPTVPAPSPSPTIVPAQLARRQATASNPFPGRLLVQWPARALSVRLPVKVGEAPLLVPPGEAPAPSNAFRITFVRLVPDFVMDPTTHEITQRSDQPANPALFVRETGPGYTLERWLFAKFPEMAMHQEAEHAAKTSPLRLRYESDTTESPTLPESIAAATESETEILAAWSQSAAKKEAATKAALPDPSADDGRVNGHEPNPSLLVSIIDHGNPCQTQQFETNRPLCFGGYRLQPLEPDPKRPGVALVKVEQPAGSGWVSSGAGLAVVASIFSRRSIRRRGAPPAA
ncbi:MAG: hypothetical protein IT581_22655 [Verrucomicrobiales bacterium]|nr:hypothetical protein [Verrucomicrobiales bacterium]